MVIVTWRVLYVQPKGGTKFIFQIFSLVFFDVVCLVFLLFHVLFLAFVGVCSLSCVATIFHLAVVAFVWPVLSHTSGGFVGFFHLSPSVASSSP